VNELLSKSLLYSLLNRIKVQHLCALLLHCVHHFTCQAPMKSTTLTTHLHLQDFSEWAQCQVLEFVSHFQPSTKEEVYDIMNALDDRLSTPNSAVVLATVKVFLNLTLAMPYDHQQVMSAAVVHDLLNPHISINSQAVGT
jgi:vesicle coat complex subunit